MIGTDLGLESVLEQGSWKEETEKARTALDPMDNVKGQKIHLGDNLLDEVGTRVRLHFKEDCLMPKYTNFCCDNLR